MERILLRTTFKSRFCFAEWMRISQTETFLRERKKKKKIRQAHYFILGYISTKATLQVSFDFQN